MTQTVYFGTYTRRVSKGIYKAEFDTEKGQLSNLELVAEEPSPTYLAFDQADHLYTVGAKTDKAGLLPMIKKGSCSITWLKKALRFAMSL